MSNVAMNRNNTSTNIDWWTLGIMTALITIGWFMIYSVGYGKNGYSEDLIEFLTKTLVGKQSIWVLISFIAFIFVMVIDWKAWRTFSYIVYGFAIFLLILVPFIGTEINGQRAWFGFGSFSFQPSELGKFGTALALSSYLSTYSTNLQNWKSLLIACGILLLPIMLIMLQPDDGSALVFFSFSLVLFREGLSPWPFILGFIVTALFIVAFIFGAEWVTLTLLVLNTIIIILSTRYNKAYWVLGYILLGSIGIMGIIQNQLSWVIGGAVAAFFAVAGVQWMLSKKMSRQIVIQTLFLGFSIIFCFSTQLVTQKLLKPHQKARFEVWLTPSKCDPRGALYNVLQSKMAISSGGIQGKGFLEGAMTKLNYVPEQSTDFIFCTVGEEHGFIGSFLVIGLFAALLIRLTMIAERQRNNFSRLYIYSILGIFLLHFVVNISMTMGLLPTIGIPLPFISKGGSSLLFFTLMMAVALKSDSHRYSV
jgi:rod shape determining protein RodA